MLGAVMTSCEDTDTLSECFQVGANDSLQKPVHRDLLLSRVLSLVRERQLSEGRVHKQDTEVCLVCQQEGSCCFSKGILLLFCGLPLHASARVPSSVCMCACVCARAHVCVQEKIRGGIMQCQGEEKEQVIEAFVRHLWK